jgi:tetratricopeptide (TPR) repeat protein
MSSKAAQEKATDKVSASQVLNDFLQKNRVLFITVLVAIFAVIGAFFVFSVVTENRNNAAFEQVETTLNEWETARAETDTTGLAAKEDGFIVSLKKVADANKGSFGGTRANMTIAEIYFSRKDWQNAEAYYLAAAKASPKAYTAGLNYFNAGICADELGKADDAVSYLNKAVELDNFTMTPRALFNIGRIEEQRSNIEAATVAYTKMTEKYPDDDWTLLAKSRMIALKIQ